MAAETARVGTNDNDAGLLRESLKRSKARFSTAAKKHRSLAVLLVHRATPRSEPEPLSPNVSEVQAKYQLNRGSGPIIDPIADTPGWNRSYSLYGDMFSGSTQADYSEAV